MIQKPITVLITAAGSPLGQSIYKALTISSIPVRLFLSDISPMAAGFFLNSPKRNIVLPLVKNKNFDSRIKHAILKHRIDCIFPVLEIEHQYFHSESLWYRQHNVRIVTLDKTLLNRCYDKFACMTYLKKAGIAVPDTIIGEPGQLLQTFLKTHPFPLFLKPKVGASSTDTFLVKSYKQLLALLSTQNKHYFILQTFLPTLPEYTIGVYRSRDGSFERTCVIERELKFGLSYKGTVINNPTISSYALNVVRALELYYSSNVQLRMVDGIPFVFEVNPRLSSTTTVRAHFGFNEPAMILLELFDTVHTYTKGLTYGTFARAWEEFYLPKPTHL